MCVNEGLWSHDVITLNKPDTDTHKKPLPAHTHTHTEVLCGLMGAYLHNFCHYLILFESCLKSWPVKWRSRTKYPKTLPSIKRYVSYCRVSNTAFFLFSWIFHSNLHLSSGESFFNERNIPPFCIKNKHCIQRKVNFRGLKARECWKLSCSYYNFFCHVFCLKDNCVFEQKHVCQIARDQNDKFNVCGFAWIITRLLFCQRCKDKQWCNFPPYLTDCLCCELWLKTGLCCGLCLRLVLLILFVYYSFSVSPLGEIFKVWQKIPI